jgi:hypothetical protein
MSPDDGAIDNQMLHIRVIGKMVMHLLPNAVITPAGKAFVDAIPGAVLLWQQAPGGPATGDPQDAFNKASALTFMSHVSSGTVL